MLAQKHIRVMIIDDHRKVHMALSALIETLDDIEIIAQGSSAEEAIDLCEEYEPDVVLMDVVMPGMGGIEATKQILAIHPDIKILALSGFKDRDSIKSMLDAGAVGYLLKVSSIEDIANTIRSAYSGNAIFSMEVASIMLGNNDEEKSNSAEIYGITPREKDVLKLLVAGKNNGEIATALSISLSTVKHHVSNILAKLEVTSRVEAVAIAVQERLVD